MSESQELSTAQEAALPTFLKFFTRQDICDALAISDPTYTRWMANPIFYARVKELRDQLLQDTIDTLKSVGLEAVKVMVVIMRDSTAPVLQLKAANDILTHLTKWKEFEDIELRLRIVEKNQNNQKS